MTLLPTTMVGSYPRPSWFTQQLAGRDVLEAFKEIRHQEAFEDAVRVVLDDQEQAGLDIVTDGQMWFDDYSMGIGSFLWYWFERIHGFGNEKLPHPAAGQAGGDSGDAFVLDEAGGVAVIGELERGPLRLAHLYKLAQAKTSTPVKACVGAGPIQLATLAHFKGGPLGNRYELAEALSDIFRAEISDLVQAGCKHIQLEDLGAWIPNLSGSDDFDWVLRTVDRTLADVPADVETSWHFCLGNAWGNRVKGMTEGGYTKILHRYHETRVGGFVLDYACRGMVDMEALGKVPADKRLHVGVIDVRSLEIEPPEQVAQRIRTILKHVNAERVTLTTDCGMKQLPRVVAQGKLKSLTAGARIVRRELTGE